MLSCNSNGVKKPSNFIPKETMINLLVDMKISNKTRNIKNINKKKNLNYMGFVFDKYQIDSTQFKENNIYYVNHIEKYQEIYIEVDKRLKDSLAKYENVIKKNDSIKNSRKQKLPEMKKEMLIKGVPKNSKGKIRLLENN